jgi:hypothetical protein
VEDQNDYEALFNSCNAPLKSASKMDQMIVEAESRNSKQQFFNRAGIESTQIMIKV